ncbi:MAG TPA: hypothetical protein VGJ15_06615, partial [Pirellulales bacterium]
LVEIAGTEATNFFGKGCRMTTTDLFDHPDVLALKPGFVAEFHQCEPDGHLNLIAIQTVANFVTDWAYALVGRSWNERVYEGEIVKPRGNAKYIGIIHRDGAFLVEVDRVGAAS